MDEPFLHIETADIDPIKQLISKRFDSAKTIIIATQHVSIMQGLSTQRLSIEDPSLIHVTSGGDLHV
jgi:hypothetical protein